MQKVRVVISYEIPKHVLDDFFKSEKQVYDTDCIEDIGYDVLAIDFVEQAMVTGDDEKFRTDLFAEEICEKT